MLNPEVVRVPQNDHGVEVGCVRLAGESKGYLIMVRLRTILCRDPQQVGTLEARAYAVLIPSLEQKAEDTVAIVNNSRRQGSVACCGHGIDVRVELEKNKGKIDVVGSRCVDEGRSAIYTTL